MPDQPRVFLFNGTRLEDPDPQMPADQVKQVYAGSYPALTNASVLAPREENGKQVYEFKASVGTKG